MSGSSNTSSQYHHSIGSSSLSPLSLILICSVIGFLAGCGVWYFFLRVTFKHDFTTSRRLIHQKLMLINKQEEKSEKTIIPYVASPGQDEEKHIEIVSQSSVHKWYYYGDISLLDPFGKSHRMQTQQPRRRSSSARQRQAISQNDDDGEVDDDMIATQLAESPCARLFSSSKAKDLNSDARPNRMWGPRVNVKNRTGLPPRTLSRTISFWKRTSVMAMKYADGVRYGAGVGIGEAGSHTIAEAYVARVQPNLNANAIITVPITPPVQGQGRPRRPLPQLPPLPPHLVTHSKNSPAEHKVAVPMQSAAAATATTPGSAMCRSASALLQDRRFSVLQDSHRPRHTFLSSSILYTPKTMVSEKTGFSTELSPLDLGMDELRAAVDCKSTTAAITSTSESEESGFRKLGSVQVPVFSTVIHTKNIGLEPNLGDPYLRVQKILERAYSRTQ